MTFDYIFNKKMKISSLPHVYCVQHLRTCMMSMVCAMIGVGIIMTLDYISNTKILISVAPVCTTPPHLYALSVGDKADIPCNVAANPTQVIVIIIMINMIILIIMTQR